MPVPTVITDLSATPGSNSPAGTDNVFPDLDNYLRAHGGFIRQLYDGDGEFLQAGTGATSRTVESKLRESVSVKDFGAVGDGVTDDRPAFVLANATGNEVYVSKPAVSYTFSSPLAMIVPLEIDPSATWDQITDGGQLTFTNKSPFQNSSPPAPIHRLGGRVFVGSAADELSGLNASTPDQGGAWFGNATIGANYVSRDASLVAASKNGRIAIAGVARSSDSNVDPAWNATIGVASHVINDRVASGPFAAGNAWGFIAEIQDAPDVNVTHGIEIGAKNKKGVNANTDPYLVQAGVTGVWLAGGGDAAFGGAATGPADAAIVVLRSGVSGLTGGGWMSGIVFRNTSLQGADGTAGSGGRGEAIRMARGHEVTWYEPTTGEKAFSITSTFNDTAGAFKLLATANELRVTALDESGTFGMIRRGASVNDYLVMQSGNTAARLNAEGVSTDVDIYMVPKGAGVVRFGTYTSTGDVACNGYITIRDAGGTTRRLMTTA